MTTKLFVVLAWAHAFYPVQRIYCCHTMTPEYWTDGAVDWTAALISMFTGGSGWRSAYFCVCKCVLCECASVCCVNVCVVCCVNDHLYIAFIPLGPKEDPNHSYTHSKPHPLTGPSVLGGSLKVVMASSVGVASFFKSASYTSWPSSVRLGVALESLFRMSLGGH